MLRDKELSSSYDYKTSAPSKIVFYRQMNYVMTNPKSKAQALSILVMESRAAHPYDFDGFEWCAVPQPELAEKLGCSVETHRRLISRPPFLRARTHKNGKPITLIRIGDPGPKTVRHVANIMSKIWRQKFGKTVPRRDYGCMIGLAEIWPEGHQVEIFKLVISNQGWPAFMAGVHIEIALLGDDGNKRFYEFPSMSVIRRFPGPAVELYVMEHQANASQGPVAINPPKLSTINPKLGKFPLFSAEAEI